MHPSDFTRSPLSLRLGLVVATSLLVLVGACGGTAASESASTAAPNVTFPPSTLLTTTTTTEAPTTTTQPPATFDAMPATPPGELSSFVGTTEVEMTAGDLVFSLQSDGVYTETAYRCDTTIAFSGFEFPATVIAIPDRIWFASRGGAMVEATRVDDDVLSVIGSCPASPVMWQDWPTDPFELAYEPDVVNGIEARRFELTDALDTLGGLGLPIDAGDDFDVEELTIWVAERGGFVAGVEIVEPSTPNRLRLPSRESISKVKPFRSSCRYGLLAPMTQR